MNKVEFDKFADEYNELHKNNIGIFGEPPEYFAEYKISDVSQLSQSRSLNVRSIVDFGAGIGSSVPYFHRYFPEATLTCLDVSEKSLAVGRARFSELAEFMAFDGTAIPLDDNSVDLVFAACVFHHIPHVKHVELLHEWYRVLKPEGMAVIFEHNPFNPLTMRAVNTCPFDENAELIPGGIMKTRMQEAGFMAVGMRYRIFIPRVLKLLRPLERRLYWCPLGAQYFTYAIKSGAT